MLVNLAIRGACAACLALVLTSSGPAEEITLRQAVDIAIANNPAIAAARLSAEAAKHSAKGARALANPDLVIAPSVVGDAGSDSALFFSQSLEINGSRRVRGEIASHEAAAAALDADAVRRDITFSVTRSYWEVARAQQMVELSRENMRYLDTIRAAVQKQYDVGAVPGAQLLKIDVELARARQELAQAELGLSQSRTELNALMGRPGDPSATAAEPLAYSAVAIDREALKSTALMARPEVASAQAELLAARARTKAAQLLRVPDLAVQGRMESFDRDSDGGVALALTLPILDWGSAKADKRSAEAAAGGLERRLEATRNDVLLQVEQAIQRLETASSVAGEYESGIIGKSEQLAEMARKGYEKGANSYLEVLEAQRTLRSIRSEYYSVLAEHSTALAQLEWAAACPVRTVSEVEK